MITIKPYAPILRWRTAEMSAVEQLYPQDHDSITPIIEFIMPAPKRDKDDYKIVLEDSKSIFLSRLPMIVPELKKVWGQDPVFVDVHLLDGDIRASSLEIILREGNQLDIFSIPVVYILPVISTNADLKTRKVAVTFAKIADRGLCIRIDAEHLNDSNLAQDIKNFLSENGLVPKHVDVLVDLGVVDDTTDSSLIENKLSSIPFLNEWRSFILAGGAFPRDLSQFAKHEHHKIARNDLSLWQKIAVSTKLVRKPFFSDYTIQHPIFYGYVPGANPSASIRYTSDEVWEVDRGEGLRNKTGAGHKQYPAEAQVLIQQPFFKGPTYSSGDSYIADRGSATNIKSGNPTTWLTAGINHHLTLVARQISSLLSQSKSV